MYFVWNPWHGCRKYSEGCLNCYMFRRDLSVGRDPEAVYKTAGFYNAIKKRKDGSPLFPPGSGVFICMTSDFFIEEADTWRDEIWEMVRLRPDLKFSIVTKRIARFSRCIPEDWGRGYDNVSVMCTVENQNQCDVRMPVFQKLPVKRKEIIAEPILSGIDMSPYLGFISSVTVGGESGAGARVCDYDWILDIRRQCMESKTDFYFKQTGAVFKKDGRIYRVPRKLQQAQAERASINLYFGETK